MVPIPIWLFDSEHRSHPWHFPLCTPFFTPISGSPTTTASSGHRISSELLLCVCTIPPPGSSSDNFLFWAASLAGILVHLQPGWNLCLLQWMCGVLTTGWPRKSHLIILSNPHSDRLTSLLKSLNSFLVALAINQTLISMVHKVLHGLVLPPSPVPPSSLFCFKCTGHGHHRPFTPAVFSA